MAAPVSLKDLTIDNITENVHAINSQCSNLRLKYILERVVTHMHDLARETRLTTDEWMAAIQFLTQVGQISSDVRQVCVKFTLVLYVADLGRNSFYSPTFSVFLSWWTRSITQSLKAAPKVPFWGPSTLWKLSK